jgi:hypothetical protein
LKANPKFKPYNSIFKNLTKTNCVCTPYIVISMIITHTKEHAVAVLKMSEHKSYVHIYELMTNDLVWEVPIGEGDDNQCIKCHEVEQNHDGSHFAICYMDDGKFFVKTFGIEQETREYNINDSFGIDNWS